MSYAQRIVYMSRKGPPHAGLCTFVFLQSSFSLNSEGVLPQFSVRLEDGTDMVDPLARLIMAMTKSCLLVCKSRVGAIFLRGLGCVGLVAAVDGAAAKNVG